MNHLPPTIENVINKGINAYKDILSDPLKCQYHQTTIDCKLLPDPVWGKGIPQPGVESIFDPLHKNDPNINQKACLYYFEILDGSHHDILTTYQSFKEEERFRHRASSALIATAKWF